EGASTARRRGELEHEAVGYGLPEDALIGEELERRCSGRPLCSRWTADHSCDRCWECQLDRVDLVQAGQREGGCVPRCPAGTLEADRDVLKAHQLHGGRVRNALESELANC